MTDTWIPCTDELPPDGEIVMTKIGDGKGLRNEQKLQLRGRLWWTSDMEMYVYYAPTHWQRIED
jgi:hypothetical protein